jgi:hypothetical protein
MYKVALNGKKKSLTFNTYEQARQWIRKQLRKTLEVRVNNQPFDFNHGNGIKGHGYKILRVE